MTTKTTPHRARLRTPHKIALLVGVVLLALLGWVGSGPWRTMHGIRQAIESRDLNDLPRYIDFARLQANLKPQIKDMIARDIANQGRGIGALAGATASMLTDAAVKGMASPTGIAVLLEGDAIIKRARGDLQPGSANNPVSPGKPRSLDAFKNARTHWVSASKFVATVDIDDTRSVDFEIERQGLNWRLTNVRLPYKKQP